MRTKKVTDSKGNTFLIPVDESGYVPVSSMKDHHRNDVLLPNGKKRKPAIDEKSVSKKVYPSKMTPEQALNWWKSPNKSDVAGVDVHGKRPNRFFGKKAPVKKAREERPVQSVSDVPLREKLSRKKAVRRDPMEYSQDWYSCLPWKEDPELASKMVAEAMAIGRMGADEDMSAYLEDIRHDEVAANSRWRYDPRDTAKEVKRKKWDDFRTYGVCNKKSKKGSRRRSKETGPAVTQDSSIRLLMDRYPDLMCDESCSYCGNEVSIKAYGISKCPECGKKILPCSMCDSDLISCDHCPYQNARRS